MYLNQNSISAKLYRWYYNTDVMPENLCPYFWQLVLMWVTIVPFSIYALPFLIFTKFEKCSWGERFGVSFVFYILLGITLLGVYHLVKLYYILINMTTDNLIGVGAMLIICITAFIINYKWNGSKTSGKEKEPSIIKEFVKAKYNKYCPKIDWK